MTLTQKNELINQITAMLDKLIDVDAESPSTPAKLPMDKPMEIAHHQGMRRARRGAVRAHGAYAVYAG